MAAPMNTTSLPYLDLSDIHIQDRIGRGNFSVYKASLAGKWIAVKRMECEKNQVPHEVEVNSTLPPHPNILPLIGITHSQDGFNIFVCMELADKSLYQFLHTEKKKPSLQQGINWSTQIARGMHHLHQHGLGHHNLKSTNVLLFEREDITKLCDCSPVLSPDQTTPGVRRTHRWMAPEATGSSKDSSMVTQHCDVFSYGMVLYEMFAHKLPFADIEEGYDVVPLIREGKRPPIPEQLPLHIRELIQSCWKHVPHDRPHFDAILQVLATVLSLEEHVQPPMSDISLPYLDLNDIDIQDRIGRGNFSVYKASLGGKSIAVKWMECDKYQIPREVEVQSNLPPHPNVLQLLGVTHSKEGFNIFVCMELANKSLYQFLHTEQEKPSVERSTRWAMQIARGMLHLHQNGLAHRDLKSANVLLFEREDVTKVCDFGSARLVERTNTMTGMRGTYRWMAPEFSSKSSTKVNQTCDVFSYGMVLYEIFTHKLPFADIEEGYDVVPLIREGKRPPIPEQLPLHIRELMQSCWKQEPRDRPHFDAILQILATPPTSEEQPQAVSPSSILAEDEVFSSYEQNMFQSASPETSSALHTPTQLSKAFEDRETSSLSPPVHEKEVSAHSSPEGHGRRSELMSGSSSTDGGRTGSENTEHLPTGTESPNRDEEKPHPVPPPPPFIPRRPLPPPQLMNKGKSSTPLLSSLGQAEASSVPHNRSAISTLLSHASLPIIIPMETFKQFATHRKGFFRRKIPTANLLTSTKDAITEPMIFTRDKRQKREACEMFKLVQQFMGDRESKVKSEDEIALDICSRCWEIKGLQDELYIQLCRQITGNSNLKSLEKGWQLFAIALAFFSPGVKFRTYLEGFICRHMEEPLPKSKGYPVEVYAQYCYKRVERMVSVGGKRGLKEPTMEEVVQAKNAPFHPPLFGGLLEEVMEQQAETHPGLTVPWVVVALCEVVLSLKGPETEKIFRTPGNIDEVNALKAKVEGGSVPVESIRNPHIPASLLRLWFRELEEPLIPQGYYERCIANCDHRQNALSVVASLPDTNREVLNYLITFLKQFVTPESTACTKMGLKDIAMVWAPNILRCPSEDPELVAQNTKKAIAFLCLLLKYLTADVS